YLHRRRRRALHTAVLLLVLLGASDLLKGLDLEEAFLSWGVAGLLWWGRDAFCVRHSPMRLRSGLWRIPAIWLAAYGLAALAAVAAAPHAGAGVVARGGRPAPVGLGADRLPRRARLGAARHRPGGGLRARRLRLRRLPPARRPAQPARRGAPPPGRVARPPARLRHALLLQAAP